MSQSSEGNRHDHIMFCRLSGMLVKSLINNAVDVIETRMFGAFIFLQSSRKKKMSHSGVYFKGIHYHYHHTREATELNLDRDCTVTYEHPIQEFLQMYCSKRYRPS